MEKDGYVVQKVTAYSKDHGIDGELLKDGKRYAVQVKQFRKKAVTEPDMRQFYGSYTGPRFDAGIYVTTSTFTIPAYIWAKARNIQLIDKKKLLRLVDL